MDLAEDLLKFLMQYALDHCPNDLDFLKKMYDNELLDRIRFILANPFERITYPTAVGILQRSGQNWEFPVSWGSDLQAEHERYLVETHFRRPVMITDYPREIKAFYMKQNDDGRTVRGLDVLFPRIGEVIGGSQREENLARLRARIQELRIPEKDVWWYLDTRRFGTVPHSGFGLGFERLIQFVTGMPNIRDVIPFPRTPKNAEF
jgi:asparaginyl-tRNA synthetase